MASHKEELLLASPVVDELRDLIRQQGRITFAQFMHTCLYSPRGGFYSSRANRITMDFSTSPTSHPIFGVLIGRQLAQMWQLMGEPSRFDVVEAGSGDGALARSIMEAAGDLPAGFTKALRYVAADYEPWWPENPRHLTGWPQRAAGSARAPSGLVNAGAQRVKTAGLQAFKGIVGCVLCNELLDNFPIHRFAVKDGRVQEVFVTLSQDAFTEVLDEPSTPRLAARLAGLDVALFEGQRGEVSLTVEDWVDQVSGALERGFVLTIDYGHLASDLYSLKNPNGTLACFHRHEASLNPYNHVGEQDITAYVDFTSLMRLGDQRGLATVGFLEQQLFLMNLGFDSFGQVLEQLGLNYALLELHRMAMNTLVDPEEMGTFKVLAQAKGVLLGQKLLGFRAAAPGE